MPQLFKTKHISLLTCFASNNERLVKNVAVAAALDTCEGTQQVSGATDAELRTTMPLAQQGSAVDRRRVHDPSSCPEWRKTLLET